MKRIYTTIGLVFLYATIFSQSFYLYMGKKIELLPDSLMFVIQTDKDSAEKQKSTLEAKLQKGEIKSFQKISNTRFLVVGNKPQPEYYEYFSYVYRNSNNGTIIILPRIVVLLQKGTSLQPVLDKHKGKLVLESGGSQKYILKCNVAQSEEVFKLINKLNTMEEVVWCEPEFLSDYSIDNPLYAQQYYLHNTGQYGGTEGIDINVEPVWTLTTGNPHITVAVIDNGVDRNHEDMGNRVLEGYTIRNPTGGGEPQNANYLDSKYHGMACAGIIVASNNSLGIRGVASEVNILPVNIVPDEAYEYGGNVIEGFGSNIEIAQAINWAWRRADILSCSWGGGSNSNDITAAIDSARTFGRNGKGSVVVFASGNNYPNSTDVAYPANLDGVITVGAINNQGTIWDYSQRGTSMDLVAPSGNIGGSGNVRTTDRMGSLGANNGNYMDNFGGTSAACPQVAGVVSLILSVRPDLTESQIRTILQNTARDLGSSGFDNIYGYGLVNASYAVYSVAPAVSGPSLVCSSYGGSFTVDSLPRGATITWQCETGVLERISEQGSNPCNFIATGSGNGWVRAVITDGDYEYTTPQAFCSAGSPTIMYLDGPTTVQTYSNTSYCAEKDVWNLNAQYYWSLSQDGIYTSPTNRNFTNIMFETPDHNTILEVAACNSCGCSDNYYLEIDVNGYYRLMLSPNPSTAETTVSIGSTSGESIDANVEWNFEVYDQGFQLKARQTKIIGKEFKLNTSGWREGVYIVRANYKGKFLTEKLVVKR